MNAWDEMSKHYPHYGDSDMMRDVETALSFCYESGVKFNGEIIDIGAGTGIIDLEIALKNEVSITALDMSNEMLEILKNDAKRLGVDKKIATILGNFDEFEPKKGFDIAVASLCPAINSVKNAHKFINLTKNLGIYIAWGGYKECEFLDLLIEKPNPNIKGCIKTANMHEILDDLNIKFKSKLFKADWENIMSEEKAMQYAKTMLMRCELDIDENHIKSVVAKFRQADGVHILTKAQKGVTIFSV